jgi:hypothetical protein
MINMYNDDTELLFPSRVIGELADLRDEQWEALVNDVKDLPEDSAEHLSFVLMMVKINGCTSCNADSFRAMRGCTQCAILNIRRYRGSDKELLKQYSKARNEIDRKLNNHK